MLELEYREWIAYGLIGAVVVAAAVGGFVARRRQRWRKLRLAGDREIKRRDMQRR